MVMPIRRTLPTLAAAVAFALTGCSSDDGGSSSDSDSASEEQTPSTEAAREQDGTKGEEDAPSGDDEQGGEADGTDRAEQSEADAPGSGPSSGDLYGYWTTQSSGDTASLLFFYADKVLFVENLKPDGDICEGTYSAGKLSVECAQGGDSGWKDTEATVAVTHSPKNIDVTWASGTTLSFHQTDESPNGVPDYPRKQVPEIGEWLDERNTN